MSLTSFLRSGRLERREQDGTEDWGEGNNAINRRTILRRRYRKGKLRYLKRLYKYGLKVRGMEEEDVRGWIGI
eukprot:CAMPEP_0118649516 /NCGR_PEP_ID=MMETSP0785-20121206/9747_1 /TAXON_ID=91992 /ORGANISM="Bolidomonas pacifica, Strain CCMP 1866" /LENGTH=72 /DNA_ID=CAMNT_0006541813 /DNA_START=385 /DNA_END=600 /DNA_ORIENTATION=+